METISIKKWHARMAVLVSFVLGFVAGGLALNLYRVHSDYPARHNWLDQMVGHLGLNDSQKVQVEQILRDARTQLMEVHKQSQPRMIEIRTQTQERLRAVLTPEQWQKFEQMMQKMKERRHQRRMMRGFDPFFP